MHIVTDDNNLAKTRMGAGILTLSSKGDNGEGDIDIVWVACSINLRRGVVSGVAVIQVGGNSFLIAAFACRRLAYFHLCISIGKWCWWEGGKLVNSFKWNIAKDRSVALSYVH